MKSPLNLYAMLITTDTLCTARISAAFEGLSFAGTSTFYVKMKGVSQAWKPKKSDSEQHKKLASKPEKANGFIEANGLWLLCVLFGIAAIQKMWREKMWGASKALQCSRSFLMASFWYADPERPAQKHSTVAPWGLFIWWSILGSVATTSTHKAPCSAARDLLFLYLLYLIICTRGLLFHCLLCIIIIFISTIKSTSEAFLDCQKCSIAPTAFGGWAPIWSGPGGVHFVFRLLLSIWAVWVAWHAFYSFESCSFLAKCLLDATRKSSPICWWALSLKLIKQGEFFKQI